MLLNVLVHLAVVAALVAAALLVYRTMRRRIAAERALLARERSLAQRLAEIGHDLRTPLAALQLNLEEASAADLPEVSQGLITSSLLDVERLSAFVENLGIATRFDEEPGLGPASGTADLDELAAQVVARMQPLARRLGVTLETSRAARPLPVACPPHLARQALLNLVLDAVSRGEAGGHVAVQAEADPDGRFRVEVSDDGPGVPPDALPPLQGGPPPGGGSRRSRLALGVTAEVARRCGWEVRFEPLWPQGRRIALRGPLPA